MISDPLFNPGWTALQGVEPPADPCTQFTLWARGSAGGDGGVKPLVFRF